MKHRQGIIDFKLTEREQTLQWAANQDPDNKPEGFFRIDTDTFQCDICDSRLPHNGKADRSQHVTDVFITKGGGTLCRLCYDEFPDLFAAEPERYNG